MSQFSPILERCHPLESFSIRELDHPVAPTGGEEVADAEKELSPRETILVMKLKSVYRKKNLTSFDCRRGLQAPPRHSYNLQLKM
ncbi:hypothetical protein TNCV_236741 [Trichonephila clavipes]|nr:hypothetical protein TNCV_236741 [Trichonephila clavipes]